MLNEILGAAARFNSLLTRKFNVAGGAPSPQLTPEITPGYSFEEKPEDQILQSSGLASGFVDAPANAGQRSVVQLRNRSTGMVIVLERVRGWVAAAAATDLFVGAGFQTVNLAQLPSAGGYTYVDFRRGQTGMVTNAPAGQLTWDNNTPATLFPQNLAWEKTNNAGLMLLFEKPVILPPNGAVQVYGPVNTEIVVHLYWREVLISSGEVGPF